MSVTVNEEKFGALVYRMAAERAATAEGAAELKGFSKDQFLDTLKRITEVIDSLPEQYNVHNLYLTLNYIGSVVVSVMKENKRRLEEQTGGSA